MRTRRGRVAGLALAGLLLAGACAADRRHAARPDDDDPATISADRLDDLDEEGAMTDLLDPEERNAMAHAGLAGDARPGADEQDAGDTAGKVGLSVLSVALSVGAAVAPLCAARYGATGGVVDALRTGSGRIPPLKGLSSRTGVRPFGASPTTTTTLPCLICFFTIADQCLGPCSGGVDL